MTLFDLRKLLDEIVDPSNNHTLKENNAIKHLAYNDETGVVTLIVQIESLEPEFEKQLQRKIAEVVKIKAGYKGLKLLMEEAKVAKSITKKNAIFIGVISGKGGVGKSSVAANIAYRMMKRNLQVGIIDADIYGSSMPTILGMKHESPRYNAERKILPLHAMNMEVISTEFFTNESQPVIWRGAMLNSMLNHFFYDVKWADDTDFIIIDFPPGTGDITLDVKSIVPETKMILVTTPHLSASHVAVKAGHAAVTLGHEILGVVENMAYYVNPVNHEHEYIFGKGGGVETARALGTELIASLPIARPKNDTDLFEIDEENGQMYDGIVDYILMKTNKTTKS